MGIDRNGQAKWTQELRKRGVLWTLPKSGRLTSAVYNAPLGLYMMVTVRNQGHGKTSSLAFWTGATPWGPFVQVHEDIAWTPGNDPRSNAADAQIMPNTISSDGRSFWLVWNDFMKTNAAYGVTEQQALFRKNMHISNMEEQTRMFIAWQRRIEPYTQFNCQRVDVVTA